MEGLVLPSSQKQNHQMSGRRVSSGGSQKDLWFVIRQGSLLEVDYALALLKKNGGNIDSRNTCGLTPLHIATWRNHIPIVRRLLAAGADPDARDGESGWSSLHRALHFGHLAVASILLQFGASLTLEDSKSRTPVDLISGPVSQVVGSEHNSVVTEVFSWGSGVNYQLGTGNAHIQKLPCKIDALQGSYIKMVSAAKFHSVAISARGEVYTWGFGRGGRLGHPDFDIHSGQAAVITPRQVTSGLGSRRVKAIAAAKHHTVIATEAGEVFTWGSNREGQLGYTSVDTQPTPRRVSSLRAKIVAIAAANKHTAAISDSGEVFTWGCNKEGQLGYGTSNSASNYTPRLVEYLKGKSFVRITAAKYHTIVLGADGEVFTWGHRLVTPRRVVIARNIKKSETAQLKFHRMQRLHVVAVAAGMVHSVALTEDGALFYWVSSDPDLRCQQLYSMGSRNIVSISAGKYWTAAVTNTGDIYMWDGKKGKGETPFPTRLNGVKRATSVSVGETHLMMVSALYQPSYFPEPVENPQKLKMENVDDSEEFDEDCIFNSMVNNDVYLTDHSTSNRPVPSLKSLCEKVVAEKMVDAKNSISLLEIADSLGAEDLRKHCEDMAIRNLDYIFTVAAQSVAGASPDILANLEKVLDMKSSEPWSYRRLPTPTATFPAVINSEEEDNDSEYLRVRENKTKSILKKYGDKRLDCFLQPNDAGDEAIIKQIRALRKKLQQIDMLEAKQASGHHLDDQQVAKLETRSALENALADLGAPVEGQGKPSSPSVEGKISRKVEGSKKLRRKNKQKATQVEITSSTNYDGGVEEPHPIKGFLDIEIPLVSEGKEVSEDLEDTSANQVFEESSSHSPKKTAPTPQKKTPPSAAASKKKNKKGGLSMFLSGALDDAPKEVAPPPTPKSEGPAWGGAKIPTGATSSLREIQSEQIKRMEGKLSGKTKVSTADRTEGKSGQIRLSSFLPIGGVSSPTSIGSVRASTVSEGEKGTPPWAAAGTSPIFCRPSLRDIQMQQEKRLQQNSSHSPKTSTTGFSISSSQGSPSDSSGGVNRWFKPEISSPSPIRSIQIEEKAMKDLKRFYSSVKLVKNQN